MINRNASQKTVGELQTRLSEEVIKYKSSNHKLKKVEAQLQQVQEAWLEEWKTTPEGLNYLGKMASAYYRLAARETKQLLRAMLLESHADLDWGEVEAEFDCRIALENEAKAQAKNKGEASQTPGASGVQGAFPSSADPTADLPLLLKQQRFPVREKMSRAV